MNSTVVFCGERWIDGFELYTEKNLAWRKFNIIIDTDN